MPRFIPTRSGAGIPAIQDTAKKRIVATFFIDKDAPDAAENMLKVCCDALNAVAPTGPHAEGRAGTVRKMTRSDKKFCGSIGVRFCTIRMKIELSPAENHGGPAGRFRVRLDRRWYDLEDRKLFLCADEVAALAAEFAAGGEITPVTVPDLPVKTRVKVPRGVPGASPSGRVTSPARPSGPPMGVGMSPSWCTAALSFTLSTTL